MTMKQALGTIVLSVLALGGAGCGDNLTDRVRPNQPSSQSSVPVNDPTDPRAYNYRFWDSIATASWMAYANKRKAEGNPLTPEEVQSLSDKMYTDNLRRNAGTMMTGFLGYRGIDAEAIQNVCYKK